LGTERAVAVELERAEIARAAVDNMAQETVECAAHFEIVSLALLHSNERDTAQEYLKVREKALERAESLSQGIVNARYVMGNREPD
jgi:hypothetical protein